MQKNRRDLHLMAGRAKFDVAKDPLRPFSVTAGNKMVVAIGTSFSVELVQRQMRVVLYEGQVAVLQRAAATGLKPIELSKSSVAPVELTPGRELLASIDRPDASLVAADVSRSLSWESGQLNFVNEPLESAVEQMNRYANEQIVIGDAGTAALHVNGVFNAGDTQAFVEAVSSFSPIEVNTEAGRLVLRLKPSRKE
jgi:transmembrane sensor